MATDFGKNQATADALDTYRSLQKPQFAALINGKWGSGKTWFARKYLEYAQEKAKAEELLHGTENPQDASDAPAFCYVSLFDIIDSKEIDAAIMAAMNPLLFSKGGRFAGRIARFALEKASSFLPIGVTPDDVAKCGGIIKEICCRRPKNLVVVLDDLERSRLPMELVLGYASSLLEEADAKVILLCNGEEILPKNKNTFLKFREKVVGITLSVVPDIDSVFDNSLSGIKDTEFTDFFSAQKQTVCHILNISQTYNLRHLRRIAHEFLRIFQKLPNEIKENKDYLVYLLTYICIFSIEINGAKLKKSDFDVVYEEMWMAHKNFKDSVLLEILKKYSFNLSSIPLTPYFIKKFFFEGILLEEEITSSYKISTFNPDKTNIPVPLQLWHLFEMDDGPVDVLYEKMNEELANRLYKSPGLILHAFSLKLQLNDIGIEKQSKDEIVAYAKKYMNVIQLEFDEQDIDIFKTPMKYYKSLGFFCRDSNEFKEIYNELKKIYKEQLKKVKIEKTSKSYKYLPENVALFLEVFPFDYNKYSEKILEFSCIDIQDFSHRISQLKQLDIIKVMTHILNVVQGHYEERTSENDITPWLEDFCEALLSVSQTMPPLAGYRLSLYVKDLKGVMEKYMSAKA